MRQILVFSLLLILTGPVFSQRPIKRVFDDPEKAEAVPEYFLQGTFVGDIEDVKNGKIKAEVCVESGGKFSIVLKGIGDTPGKDKGWTRGHGEALLKDKVVVGKLKYRVEIPNPTQKVFQKEIEAELKIENKELVLFDTKTQTKQVLKRVDLQSSTLEQKPPDGAIVLFNEPADIEKWAKGANVVQVSDGKFLGGNARSTQSFRNFTLHVEFRTPFMPDSGLGSYSDFSRGHAGLVLLDLYKIQIIDSFGAHGRNIKNTCGSIYGMFLPKSHMCYPPLVWQTYDIEFTAPKFVSGVKSKNAIVSVKHNGTTIHDKLEVKSPTLGQTKAKESINPGPICIEQSPGPVIFRNIWIQEHK